MAADSSSTIIDLTKGIYRRIYAGWVEGRRINAVSEGAALAFLHFNLIADDFGNLTGDSALLVNRAFPRRAVAAGQLDAWIVELESVVGAEGEKAPLLFRYAVAGESYIHIVGFERLQTSRNGRKIRRVPPSPAESEGIPVNPRRSGVSESGSGSGTDTENDSQSDAREAPEKPTPRLVLPAPAPAAAKPRPNAARADAVRRLLILAGVDGNALVRLAACEALTPEAVTAEASAIQANGTARDTKRVLVKVLCDRHGIKLGNKSIAAESKAFADKINLMRAQKSGSEP